jgi:transcription elongation factor Elf1
MGGSKRQLEEEMARAHDEYVKESLCPECGDEREEITLDNNTFWVCDNCDGDHEHEEEFYAPDYVLDAVSPDEEIFDPEAEN